MAPSVSTPGWKAPYICFAYTPSMAWALSGDMNPRIKSWDLWQTRDNRLLGYEEMPVWMDSEVLEVRTYNRVYKRDLWYVGTRDE